jgi:hypothetical protein
MPAPVYPRPSDATQPTNLHRIEPPATRTRPEQEKAPDIQIDCNYKPGPQRVWRDNGNSDYRKKRDGPKYTQAPKKNGLRWANVSLVHLRHLTLELSGCCRTPLDSTATRRSSPLERMVRCHQRALFAPKGKLLTHALLASQREGR